MIWQRGGGTPFLGSVAVVPEPTAAILVAAAIALVVAAALGQQRAV
jgi:hypothetical protein